MGGESLSNHAEIVMGQSPPGDTCNTSGNGLPLLNGPTEYGPHHPTAVQFTTDARKLAKPGDILFCVRGSTTGRMNWADREYAIGRGVAAIRHKTKPTLQPFVRAIIEYGLPNLLAQATGSTFPNVSASQLADLPWPSLADNEQQAIACILGALDDKIELSRRMNLTLEETARAIFKSWFVGFDPVRAKAAGRQPPGLKPEIAALFPDSFEDSELGEIPKGWMVGCVDDLAYVSSGKRPNARFAEPSDDAAIPLWGGNGPMAFVREALFVTPILLTGRVGTLGSVFRITTACWPSDNTLILQARATDAYEYLFFQLQNIDFASLNRGSTQPLLTQTDLKMRRLVIPGNPALEVFSRIANALFCRFDESVIETRTLAALRDTLLPKLISGELRVPDAERIVRRCV